VREVAVFVPYRRMDIPECQVYHQGVLVAGEVGELSLVRSTDQWNNCCPLRKSMLCPPPPVCRIHGGIHTITICVHCPTWSISHVVFIWALAKEVLRTVCRVSRMEIPPTPWCGDDSCSQSRWLVLHRIDKIVHCPTRGGGKLLANPVLAIVEVTMNL